MPTQHSTATLSLPMVTFNTTFELKETIITFTTAWNGNRLASRKNGVCEWGEPLPNQCFAFGPERVGVEAMRVGGGDEGRLNTDQCREACCANKECDSWQEMPGRGCYFGVQVSIKLVHPCHKFCLDSLQANQIAKKVKSTAFMTGRGNVCLSSAEDWKTRFSSSI